MKILSLTLLITMLALTGKAQSVFVRLVTSKGNITVMLYDETPKHRDMFVQCIKTGVYKDALFNRVIKSFVSQGGELDEPILAREKLHPEIPLARIPAEIKPDLFHKKGALGAGRTVDPEKRSFINQIYLVEGKIQTDEQLDALEQKKNIKFSKEQRETYKTIGGIPSLDRDFTIFGEIVEGMDVAEAINSTPTAKTDLPIVPVVFNPVILSKKEVSTLRKKH